MHTLFRVGIRVETWTAGILLVAMVVLVLLGGIARFLHVPLNWTLDMATCAFAWATFLCADIAWRRGALMSVDLLMRRLPARLQRALLLFNYLLIVLFLVFLFVTGLWLSWASWARSFRGIPWVSYSWVTLSLPVGSLLMLLTTGFKVRRQLRPDTHAAEGEKASC
ncbi:TRAP transporter small permease subunit [Halomonas sp. HP20-15]|uniref:TRAP transporter small permease n=1 Tax=Halomonas sp. HP20-15 TaxID=3085901 RepID=UPI0029829CFB|nr:TRAP transporter small permease subunit [Halomonas sp. HP20-15]MDW5376040.1 TRAP transporter small permease subunit [Halomonas sp. HP20-15]